MSYVTIEAVTFIKVLPSGNSFVVEHEDIEYVIPHFAVSDDSEVWPGGSRPGEVGKLVITEKIAIERGLADPPSQALGGGIPLKRHRLPAPPVLMPDKELGTIEDRMREASFAGGSYKWSSAGDELHLCGERSGGILAMFDGDGAAADASFTAHAPDDMRALLDENKRLREFLVAALKTQERRRRR